MAAIPPAKPPNVFQRIGSWLKDVAEWVESTFGDPVISAQVREDLGLDASNPATPTPLPQDSKDKINEFVAKQNVDEAALAQTIGQLVGVVDTIRTFAEAAADDGVDPWDLVTLIFRVWIVDSLKQRNPAAYALCQLAGLVASDEDTLEQIDPAPVLKALRGQAGQDDLDAWLDRLSGAVGAGIVIADVASSKIGAVIDAHYGYDPAPGDDPKAIDLAQRTLTVVFTIPELGDARPALSLVVVERHEGGPGILLALSGHLSHTETVGGMDVTLDAGVGGAFELYIPFTGEPVRALSGATPSFALSLKPSASDAHPKPALIIGTTDKTRIEIGRLGLGVQLDEAGAGLRFSAHQGKLAILLGDGDSFLRQLPGGSVEVPIDIGLLLDTAHGLRLEGGTGLKVNLPVNATAFGVFTVQYLELDLELESSAKLTMSGGFSLHLGPFQATVDKIGIALLVGDVIGGTKQLDELVVFQPPKGIGLALDAGVVKGGGYLFIDAEHGEYAGALELKILTFSLKAIAVIDTKKPDGTEGWALLIMLYGQFSVHIAFGIFLTGIGGLIGLHHRADTDALSAGMRTGALDDVLFPDNPVGDAPRIINRYRALFPYEENTLILGPMLQLSFSEPPIVYLSIGLIFEVKNALGDTGPVRLSKVILLGQVLAQMPPKATGSPAILKILVDVVGFYDADQQFLLIQARLRDSFVGIEHVTKLDLGGMFVLAMHFGDEPSFVLSAGGFHPAFKDVPPGVPAQIDRLSVSFNIQIVKMRIEVYFAVTSNSVQGGAKVQIKADISVASIEGWLQFDALFLFTPTFHFTIDVDFGVSLKAFGQSLLSVHVHMQLEGPGEWHASGSFSFSILFWDKTIGFDERWGSAPALDSQTQSAASAITAAIGKDSVEPGPPLGGSALVTLAATGDATLAHPLAQVAVRQKAVPFDVQIDRLGTAMVSEGPSTWSVTSVTAGTQELHAIEPVTEWFARGQFMDLSDQDKLDQHSFERFTCGVAVGTDAYAVPGAGSRVSADYEVDILEPEERLHLGFAVARLGREVLTFDLASQVVVLGAAGRSSRAATAALRPDGTGAAMVQEPLLAVVDVGTLSPVASVVLEHDRSPAIVGQVARAAGATVVELHEVVGA
jgi:hypothetical protein